MTNRKCLVCRVSYEREDDKPFTCARCRLIQQTPDGHRLYAPGHYDLGDGQCSCGVPVRGA